MGLLKIGFLNLEIPIKKSRLVKSGFSHLKILDEF